MRRDYFSDLHPLVGLVYFSGLLISATLLMHPGVQLVTLVALAGYYALLYPRQHYRRTAMMLAVLLIFTVSVNVLFNHQGLTIITYLPSGNPITAEALAYAMAAAVLLLNMLLWCLCFSRVLSGAKIIYLCGRLLPVAALVLSLIMRLVPQLVRQAQDIYSARHSIMPPSGGIIARGRELLLVFSALVSLTLDTAPVCAYSMHNRGYGLPHRSSFQLYTLHRRDKLLLGGLGLLLAVFAALVASGALAYSYFPRLALPAVHSSALAALGCYTLISFTPHLCRLYHLCRQRSLAAIPAKEENYV